MVKITYLLLNIYFEILFFKLTNNHLINVLFILTLYILRLFHIFGNNRFNIFKNLLIILY